MRPGREADPSARPWTSRRIAEVAVGSAALAGSWWIATAASAIPSWERSLTLRINDLPDALRWPVWPVMQLGNFWMVVAVPAGMWLWQRRPRPVIVAASATFSAWLLAKVIKELADRGRPADFFDTVTVRESGVTGLGFVSGHSAVAFAAATVVGAYLPVRWAVAVFAVASLTAMSRVYYGAHFPLDIIGGAGLGIGCGALALALLREPATGPHALDAEAAA